MFTFRYNPRLSCVVLATGLFVFPVTGSASGNTSAEQKSDEMTTDRPDFTESPYTIAPGRFQIESGVTVEREDQIRTIIFGEALVRIGAGKRAEIRIGVPSYLRVRDNGRANGLDDAFLGVKVVLSENPKRPLALLLGSTLPTGARRVAEHTYQPETVLSTEVPVSNCVSLGMNLGLARPTSNGQRLSQVFGSMSLGVDLTEKVGAFAEVYGFTKTDPDGSPRKYLDGGLTYGMNDNLQLDIRAGVGLGNKTGGPDYFYGAGVSQRF